MSSINNSHSGRGRDEASQLSGRIPKKAKSSPNHDAAADDATNTVPKSADSFTNASDDDPLDAIAKARMAMMKFQEILGEKPSHNNHLADNSLSSSIGGTVAQVTDDPTKLNGEKEGDNAIDDEKEVALKEAKEKEEEEKKQKEEEKKRQEEDARQRQRIIDGEAKRRAFKPKIATALDSLL
jgi:hypothetical protein